LTVEVEADRIEQAMRKAARRISQKSRIPGFRPGKAPMNVVLNMFGKEYVLGEALDDLGNDIYREALEASEVKPYAPGSLEDISEEGRKLTFVVPKVPEVELGSYRDIRVEYEVQEVTDEMVDRAMEELRQNQALLEPVERAAQMGDQVTFEHFEVVVLPKEGAETEAADEEDEPEDADESDETGEDEAEDGERVLLHQHDFARVLRDDDEDMFPGFSAEIVGLNVGDEKTFTLSIPDDYDMDDIQGRTLRVEGHVKQVQSRLVPDWSDTLAESISQGDFKTMLELRVNVREQLLEQSKRMADQLVADEALEKLIEGATIRYPDEIVQEYVSDILSEIDRNLRGQGLTLADFLKITGRKEEDLRQEYRERAVQRAERALALGQLIHDEELVVNDADLDTEIDRMSTLLGGDQAGQFKQFLNTEESRWNIANRVASDRALDRLAAIAKGEDPAKGTPVETPSETAESSEPEA
jgi:trigger factor